MAGMVKAKAKEDVIEARMKKRALWTEAAATAKDRFGVRFAKTNCVEVWLIVNAGACVMCIDVECTRNLARSAKWPRCRAQLGF